MQTKYLYQYGNYNEKHLVIPKGFSEDDEFENKIETGVKTIYSESNLEDGEVDLLFDGKAKKSSYVFDLTIPLGISDRNRIVSNYNLEHLNSVFFDKPKLIFAYSVDANGVPNRWFYTLARTIKPNDQKEDSWNNLNVMDFYYNVMLKATSPYWYECTSQVGYISYTNFLNTYLNLDSGFNLDSGVNLDSGFTPTLISSLTNQQKIDLFTVWDDNIVLRLDEKFLTDGLNTSNNYIINQTFTANTTTVVNNLNVLGDSNADNRIYILETTPLTSGQEITITNNQNQSNITLTWLGSVATNNICFNSYTGKVYDKVTRQEYTTSSYTISYSGDLLYYEGNYNAKSFNPSAVYSTTVALSAGSNKTIRIDILPTYH